MMGQERSPGPGWGGRKTRETGRPASAVVSWVVSFVFYLLLISALAAVYLIIAQAGRPRAVFGCSAYVVISGSMQSEIPQGSLVLVRDADPDTIQIGDDITYLKADNSLITHRVVGITENYAQSGMRGFVTKGLENPEPDRETVYADNVVGKVIYHNLWLGSILSYVRDRVWVPIAAAVLLTAFYYALRRLFRVMRRSDASGKPEPEDPSGADVAELPAPEPNDGNTEPEPETGEPPAETEPIAIPS